MTVRRRGTPYHKGRWQVARERGRIEDAAPPAGLRESVPVDGIVAAVMGRLGLADRCNGDLLAAKWPELVGPGVAAHARPGRLENGRLTVFVDSSVWLNELQRYSGPLLTERVRKLLGADKVKALRFQLDPDGRAR